MLEKEELSDSIEEKNNWFLLANQLRQQNLELVKTLVSLEESLEKKQHSQDTLCQEQQAKILALEAQVTALEKELLKKEEISQNNYQQLLHANRQVQELKIRLFRQQRFTLRYKAALKNSLNSESFMTIEPWENSLEELNQISFNVQVSPESYQQHPQKSLELPSFLMEDK